MTTAIRRSVVGAAGRATTVCTTVCVAVLVTIAGLWPAAAAAAAAPPRVFLLRGWFGVFSTGLDTMAERLKAQGIDVEVDGHLEWSNVVKKIVREHASGPPRRLVLVGHSQGANNVIDVARALQSHGIAVDLLVTISPFWQKTIPANVVRAVDYYQAPGWGQPLEADSGFHGKLDNVNLVGDLGVTHITMDKSQKIQAEIMREITALAPGADDQPAVRR